MAERNDSEGERSSLASLEAPIEPMSPTSEEIELGPVSAPPASQSSAGPLLWVVGGLLIGAAATLFFTQIMPRRTNQPTELVMRPPIQKDQAPKTVASNSTGAQMGPPPPGQAQAEPKTADPSKVQPLDPMNFGLRIPREINTQGSFGGPILPKAAYSGQPSDPNKRGTSPESAPGGKPAAATKTDAGGNKQAAPVKASVQLLTITASVSSPSDARVSLASWAREAGGSAQTFKGYDDRTENPTEGVLVFVPEAKLQDFIAYARTLGIGPVDETWVGTPGARGSRLVSAAEAQLKALQQKKDELLKTYYEDASQVRHTAEGIEILTKNMGNLRPPKAADGLEAVKVVLLAR